MLSYERHRPAIRITHQVLLAMADCRAAPDRAEEREMKTARQHRTDCDGTNCDRSCPKPTAQHTPRIIGNATELSASNRQCTRCGEHLTGHVAWLELDQRTGQYHDRGGVPTEVSQGWFPFGIKCARALLARIEGT